MTIGQVIDAAQQLAAPGLILDIQLVRTGGMIRLRFRRSSTGTLAGIVNLCIVQLQRQGLADFPALKQMVADLANEAMFCESVVQALKAEAELIESDAFDPLDQAERPPCEEL